MSNKPQRSSFPPSMIILDFFGCGCGCGWPIVLGALATAFIIWTLYFYHPQTIEIHNTGFYAHNHVYTSSSVGDSDIEVDTGETIVFKNTSVHAVMVCLGGYGDCTLHTTGAQALRSPGMSLEAHQSKEISFDNPGEYTITLYNSDGTRFSNVNFTVDVTEPSNDD